MSITIDGTAGISTTNLTVNAAAYTVPEVLTFNHPVGWDWSIAQSAQLTLTGNTTLSNPINAVDGQYAALRVSRAGSYVLSFDTNFKGISNITQSPFSGMVDHFVFRYNAATGHFELVSFTANMGA